MRKISHWLEEYSVAESLDVLTDLACMAARKAGPTGARLEALLRKKDLRAVCDFEVDYAQLSIEEARYLRQALACFTKLEFLDIGVDAKAAAIKSFEDAELHCRETNAVFRAWAKGEFNFPRDVEGILHRAKDIIARVLGPVPSTEMLGLRFGPGATSLTKKREASIRRKLGSGISCSEELLPWAARLLAELPLLTDLHATVIRVDEDGDEWSTVPIVIHEGMMSFAEKNAKTKRLVLKQPVLNGMLQLALGDHQSARCKAFGLDLSDQSRNREGARIGSLTGALATLDQTGASDRIALELVAHLCPLDWFSIMHACRTGRVSVNGVMRPQRLEQMASMGNGYTFPLESLIFWALALACLQRVCPTKVDQLRVFGDDVIVPTEAVPLVMKVYHAVGFLVNSKKSYWTGPFRESCGADYFSGVDIRPVYVKEILTPAILFTLHNGLRRRGMEDLADWVCNLVHPALRIFGPDGFGDGHLISESWQGRPKGRSRGFEGTIFDTFTRIPKRDIRGLRKEDQVLPQYSVYRRGCEPLLPPVPGLLVGNFPSLRGKKRFVPGALLEVGQPSMPIPWKESDMPGVMAKAVTFPGVDGYKKIAIYTLRG